MECGDTCRDFIIYAHIFLKRNMHTNDTTIHLKKINLKKVEKENNKSKN